ncbi:M48 family metallopeptidase [Paramagnetospirillum caucaseum]|nr:M48 family metallopeptidase [Paramagnetospirillum caucaseum]
MKLGSCLTAVAMVAALGGCAPQSQRPAIESEAVKAEELEQKKLVIKTMLDQRDLLYRISYRLAKAGADLCGDQITWSLGFLTLGREDGAETDHPTLAALFPDLGNNPIVSYIPPDSVAAAAGLRKGDEVILVGEGGVEPNRYLAANIGLRLTTTDNNPVKLKIRRNGTPLDIAVTPARSCNYPAGITSESVVNAFADGRGVYIAKGMMDFVRTDEELALVTGHELAHNFRKHRDAKQGNAVAGQVAGTILDILVAVAGVNTGGAFGKAGAQLAGNANSVEFEGEADYAGLYVMARAGYAIDDAPTFWRRMGANNPNAISHATTHPATAERFVALNAAIKEIKTKQQSGAPLVPNEKPKEAAPQPLPGEPPLGVTP